MRTAQEMHNYISTQNHVYQGIIDKRSIKHFVVLAELLDAGETVQFCFVGMMLTVKGSDDYVGDCAVAFTEKRLIVARKKTFGTFSKQLPMGEIRGFTAETGLVTSALIFETVGETFTITIGKGDAERFQEHIDGLRQGSGVIPLYTPSPRLSTPDDAMVYTAFVCSGCKASGSKPKGAAMKCEYCGMVN